MMRVLLCVFALWPLFLRAQERGIIFLKDSGWNEILEKARAEKKYIFVDCYASWCGPCKLMDKQVYPNDTVGEIMNAKFISIKVQMDTGKQDDETIQRWYATAHNMMEFYQVKSYPTYLFFSPEGEIVHRDGGATDAKGFLTIISKAMDPDRQFYILLKNYLQGKKEFMVMPYLANTLKKLKQDSLSLAIAGDYIHQYLEYLPSDRIWTTENLDFISSNAKILRSADRLFQLYYRDKKVIDSIMNESGYADGLINYVVYREEILPLLKSAKADGSELDWDKIETAIGRKYDSIYAERNVVSGKAVYYRDRKEWSSYAKYLVLELEEAGIRDWHPGGIASLVLNNDAFEVFKYSKDKRELEEALSWVERVIATNATGHPQAEFIDTKANLLYKLGRKSEALTQEERSLRLSPDSKDIRENYEKMKSGLPTWPLE
jgi:thioredoxin-related protein